MSGSIQVFESLQNSDGTVDLIQKLKKAPLGTGIWTPWHDALIKTLSLALGSTSDGIGVARTREKTK
jgi:hypothetical protein